MPKFPLVRLDWGFLLLLPIPLLWALFAQQGALDRPENQFLALRFHARGEIPAPVKLIYVDVDTRALQALGERPWNREQFGAAAEVLMEKGGARAVGFDFVFSSYSYSKLVDAKAAAAGNLAFARVIRKHPGIVLGVQYTEGQSVTQNEETPRRLPLLRLGYTDRTKNDVPEMPQSPLVGPMWGRVGLIDFDKDYGGDEVPRWVPLFAHTMNPTLYPSLPFNAMTDLVPIVQIAEVPNVLVVHPSIPAKTLAEFVAHAKANPGKLNYASTGIGTSAHLSAFVLAKRAPSATADSPTCRELPGASSQRPR